MAQESSEQESVEHEFRIRFTARDLEILEGALARDLLARSDGALDDTTVEDFVWRKFVVGGEVYQRWAEANRDALSLFGRLRRKGRTGAPSPGQVFAGTGYVLDLKKALDESKSLGVPAETETVPKPRAPPAGRMRRRTVPKRPRRGHRRASRSRTRRRVKM